MASFYPKKKALSTWDPKGKRFRWILRHPPLGGLAYLVQEALPFEEAGEEGAPEEVGVEADASRVPELLGQGLHPLAAAAPSSARLPPQALPGRKSR